MDSFPTPVLAAAADVIKHVDGDDSLPILWTFFTKFKESLQDGHRLENISWRLWYQSMVAANFPLSSDLLEPPPDAYPFFLNETPYRPLTPDELPRRAFTTDCSPLSSHGIINPLHTPPLDEQSTGSSSVASSLPNYFSHKPFSSTRRNSFRKASSPVNVGKILCELFPSAPVPSLMSLGSGFSNGPTLPVESPPTQYGNLRALSSVSLPLSSPLSHFVANIRHTITSATENVGPPQSLPTPEAEEGDSSLGPSLSKGLGRTEPPAILPVIMADNSSPANRRDELLSTAHEHPPSLPLPPLLVVVKPTPDPTPHPTPPATPVQRHSIVGQEEDADAVSSVPRLNIPGRGQHALIQAQTRGSRCSQSQSTAQLVIADGDGNPLASGTNLASARNYDPTEKLPMILALPASANSERAAHLVSNLQSISLDTTSSSSQRSSFTPSEFSKATTATTISEPYHCTHHIEKRSLSFVSSPSLDQVTAGSDTGLLPTSPLYESEMESSAPKRRKEKATSLGSTTGKLSGSSTSKAPGSLTSNKGASPSFRPTNTARKLGNNKGGNEAGASTATGRSRTSKSRSRSRTRESGNAALHALVMTRAAASGRGAAGKAAIRTRSGGGVRRGKSGVAKKVNMNEVVREGVVMFNFGSTSEEGSKSTGTGSGSEVIGRRERVESGQNDEGVAKMMEDSSSHKGTDVDVPAPPPVEEKAAVVSTDKEKGKGKEKAKSGVTTTIEATIADPLLPGSVRRQIVLTSDDDSEGFETETDSWSDTESADAPTTTSQQRLPTEMEQSQVPQQPQQQQQQQQQQRQQQRQQHRPTPSRTHSDHFPRNNRPVTRAYQRLAEQRAAEDRRWKEEMFVKLPKASFENLAKINRTRSGGLLSQLLKPEIQPLSTDPTYRRGFSSGVIQPLRPFTPVAQQQPQPQPQQQVQPQQQQQTQTQQQQQTQHIGHKPPSPVPDTQAITTQQISSSQPPPPMVVGDARPSQHSRQPSRTYQLPKRLAALTKPSIVASKTPVASAVMSELRVGSINGVKQVTTGGVSVNGSAGKYKPKGRPPETVMEYSSDSETDDNQLDLSKSVAQEKLRALLEAKKLKKSAQGADSSFLTDEGQNKSDLSGGRQASSQPVEPISIPPPRLLYPYNLPPPNPPTTPRTTRRKMLAVEIPESLRRNLLWERQVSQAHARGLGRRRSMNDVKGWHIPNLVKLTPKGAKQDEPNDVQKERDRRYLARTRSWAFQYHAVGW